MTKLLNIILYFSWALWLGGLVALLMFVLRLFEVSRAIAVEAAPILFLRFASYQIIVGLIACSAATLLAIRSRRKSQAIFALLLVTALGISLLLRAWTIQMEQIRAEQGGDAPAFKAMHARTSISYTTMAILLSAAGIGFIVCPSRAQTATEAAPA
jgi:hypothetical protein